MVFPVEEDVTMFQTDGDEQKRAQSKEGQGSPEIDQAERDRCKDDREKLDPHETADCAGESLAEAYENEEDGGS